MFEIKFNTSQITPDGARALSIFLETLANGDSDFSSSVSTVATASAVSSTSTSTAPAAVTASSEERDIDGFPWDERIHAGNKAKTEAGKWVRKRKVEDAVYNAVVAELRAGIKARTMAAAETIAAEDAAETVETVSAAEAFTASQAPTETKAPPPPPPTTPAVNAPANAGVPATTSAPAPAGGVPSFAQITARLTQATAAGLFPEGYQHIFAACGLSGLPDLISASDDVKIAVNALIPASA